MYGAIRVCGGHVNSQPRPHGEAEQSVLGAVLVRPETLDEVVSLITPLDFQVPAHRMIYEAMLAIQEKDTPVDLVTVSALLKERGQLRGVGGPVFLAGLSEQVGFATNALYYAQLIKNASLRKRLHDAGLEIAEIAAKSPAGEIQGAIDRAGGMIYALADRAGVGDAKDCAVLVAEMSARLEYAQEFGVVGVKTELADMDNLLLGFQPKDLIILAARPSMGKTALALNIAENVTSRGDGVLFFSLEMGDNQLMLRLTSSMAEIGSQLLRTALLTGPEWARYEGACNRIVAMPLYIDDTSGLSPLALRSRARRMCARKSIKLIIVDYLQLMSGTGGAKQGREGVIREVSGSLKEMAKELNLPVLALSQLNRECEGRPDKRPQLSDLRESGAIEQDADVAMFIYRDEVYNPNSLDAGTAEVIVRKNRNGPIGMVRLAFNGPLTRFNNFTAVVEGEA